MKDYKELYLMVWATYMSPWNSIVGLYFKRPGPQKDPLNVSFCKLSEKLISLLESSLNSLTFQTV